MPPRSHEPDSNGNLEKKRGADVPAALGLRDYKSLPAAAGPDEAEASDDGIEIDLDMNEPAATSSEPAEATKDPLGLGGRLLKRFGIT